MVTMLLLMISWIFIMFVTMSVATFFYLVYGVIWTIAKMFKNAKLEAKAASIRKKTSMKYWSNKQAAKDESMKQAKSDDVLTIASDRLEKEFGVRKPESGKQCFKQTMRFQEIKREVKKEKKQAKKLAKKGA